MNAAVDLYRLDDLPDVKMVLRADWDRIEVALVSGGGSGQKPAREGRVGAGVLMTAVCGVANHETLHASCSAVVPHRVRQLRMPAPSEDAGSGG